MARVLVLGAGYIGAKLGELALGAGHEVVLADNWFATERSQLDGLAAAGARVETADIREDIGELLDPRPDVVHLLAAQASRPLSERDPDYTEETNVSGTRRVGRAIGEAKVPAHLSKIYGEVALALKSRRFAFDLAILRLGIVYGPSPVEHSAADSQTVVDKFRQLAQAGEELPVDEGGRATIGVVHVADAARILLDAKPGAENVAAETVTVADVAALARGEDPAGAAAFTITSPFAYEHRLADYLRR